MFTSQVKNKKYYLIFTLYFLGFGILIAILVSFIDYKTSFTDINKKLKILTNTEVTYKRDYLYEYISKTEMILSSLTKNELTLKYIKNPTPNNEKNLNDLFYALAYANKSIMQLRYLDESGKEIIRIDRDKKSPELIVIPKNQMQDKSDRYYFQESTRLMANQFWHSNIDLNIERKKIEIPIKPTFRVATQLIIKNKFKGIMIANLLFDDTLSTLTSSSNFYIYLIDKNGAIIHDPLGDNSWSKYLDNKKNIYSVFPQEANQILHNTHYETFGVYSYTLGDLFKNHENIKIIFKTKQTALKGMKEQNIFGAFIIALSVLLVSIPLSWIVSIIPSNLQNKLAQSYEKIKKDSEIIDQNVMIYKTDKDGVLTSISKKFTQITGYAPNELLGKKCCMFNPPNISQEISQNLWDTVSSGHSWENEIKSVSKEGKDLWFNLVVSPEFTQAGEIKSLTTIANNIAEKKLLERLSSIDALTNLYNRRKIEEILINEIARFQRYQSVFSIIIIDIDKFKNINDTYGHQAGDEVLVALAKLLKENSRATDFVGRWGGEEFIIICSQTNVEGAFDLAQILRKLVETHKFVTKENITISCGVAQYNIGEKETGLFSRADVALYKAKGSGRNRVIIG